VKQRKEAAHREVPAIDQIALQTDQEGLAVFLEGREHREQERERADDPFS
jgi:hypothetical protein